jgi:phosphoribosyl 1,2-cyclic phosphodiesterase
MRQETPLADTLSVTFWGVRGSYASPGNEYARYGGHTPCLEVRAGEHLIIIDAGTGLGPLGAHLGQHAPKTVNILLSHLHLDHVMGLPFFKPALFKDRTIRLHCGNLGGKTAKMALNRLFSPPIFPVTLAELPGHIKHVGFRAGETVTLNASIAVRTILLNHPSGATGYRVDHGGRSICYLSDLEHTKPWPDPALAAFVQDADLVIYDAMFSEHEYSVCHGWGHSTWNAGLELAKAAGVKAFAIFHLHPRHDDNHMDEVERQAQAIFPGAFVARQGATLAYPALAVAPILR